MNTGSAYKDAISKQVLEGNFISSINKTFDSFSNADDLFTDFQKTLYLLCLL